MGIDISQFTGVVNSSAQWLKNNTKGTATAAPGSADFNFGYDAKDNVVDVPKAVLESFLDPNFPNSARLEVLRRLNPEARHELTRAFSATKGGPGVKPTTILGSDPLKATQAIKGPAFTADWSVFNPAAPPGEAFAYGHALSLAAVGAYPKFPTRAQVDAAVVKGNRMGNSLTSGANVIRAADWQVLATAGLRVSPQIRSLLQAGYDVTFLRGPKSTEAFVAVHPQEGVAITSFRGTEASRKKVNWWDIGADLKFRRVEGHGGRVHRGFKAAYEEVKGPLQKVLAAAAADFKKRGKGRSLQVHFTGHSLGAAVATLAAEDTHARKNLTIASVHTFESPRVFDASAAVAYERRLGLITYRHRVNEDMVTRIPPESFGYVHVGNDIFYNANGRLLPGGSPIEADDFARFLAGKANLRRALGDHGPHGLAKHLYINPNAGVTSVATALATIEARLAHGKGRADITAVLVVLSRFADRPIERAELVRSMSEATKAGVLDVLASQVDRLTKRSLFDWKVTPEEMNRVLMIVSAVPKEVLPGFLAKLNAKRMAKALDKVSPADQQRYARAYTALKSEFPAK